MMLHSTTKNKGGICPPKTIVLFVIIISILTSTMVIPSQAIATEAIIGGSILLSFLTAIGVTFINTGNTGNQVLEFIYDKYQNWKEKKQSQLNILSVLVQEGKYKLTSAQTVELNQFAQDFVSENQITQDTVINETATISSQSKEFPVVQTTTNNIYTEQTYLTTYRRNVKGDFYIYTYGNIKGKCTTYIEYSGVNPKYRLFYNENDQEYGTVQSIIDGTTYNQSYDPIGIAFYKKTATTYGVLFIIHIEDEIKGIDQYVGNTAFTIPKSELVIRDQKSITSTALNVQYPENTEQKPVTTIDIGAPASVTTLEGMSDIVVSQAEVNDLTATAEIEAEGGNTDTKPEFPAFPDNNIKGVWHYVEHLIEQASEFISMIGDIIETIPQVVRYSIYGVLVLLLFGGLMSKLLL